MNIFAVMARPPVPGHCKTRLAKTLGDARAAALYEAMLCDRLDTVLTLDARCVVLAAPEDDGVRRPRDVAPAGEVMAQRGADLGERLANGVEDLFCEGARVYLVDSDSPMTDSWFGLTAWSDWPSCRQGSRMLALLPRVILAPACSSMSFVPHCVGPFFDV
jgi:glycosyltransferase A (GT-A) superfamily protein (DUF2064 family)